MEIWIASMVVFGVAGYVVDGGGGVLWGGVLLGPIGLIIAAIMKDKKG